MLSNEAMTKAAILLVGLAVMNGCNSLLKPKIDDDQKRDQVIACGAGYGGAARAKIEGTYDLLTRQGKAATEAGIEAGVKFFDSLPQEDRLEGYKAYTNCLKLSDLAPSTPIPQFEPHHYITEIRWRTDEATARVTQEINRGEPRTAAREAWQALNGKSEIAAYPEMKNRPLIVLLDDLSQKVPPGEKEEVTLSYWLAMKMAKLGPILLNEKEFGTQGEKDEWKEAFNSFAVEPDGLWPRFQKMELWKRPKK